MKYLDSHSSCRLFPSNDSFNSEWSGTSNELILLGQCSSWDNTRNGRNLTVNPLFAIFNESKIPMISENEESSTEWLAIDMILDPQDMLDRACCINE